ncbi:HugZ family protein [Kiloniella antarctica]|uniref:HugZ family protein n=1 Tax=Kiloniella antarctica TaxID=1550907 RepID=A0ABW5BHP0_9PROT
MKKIKHAPHLTEAQKARNLMRWASKAYLATELRPDLKDAGAPGGHAGSISAATDGNYPYASLSLICLDHDATPYMLLSDLADHSQNLAANAKAGMLFDGTAGYRDPLAGGRVTLVGTMTKVEDDRMLQRFLNRHPASKLYAGFKDFSLYKYTIDAAHLIGGFAKATWVPSTALKLDCETCQDLLESESSIVEHMNSDHMDAINIIAETLLKLEKKQKWRMTGIDPEGWDLHNGHVHARCPFDQLITDANSARNALIAQAKSAREASQ